MTRDYGPSPLERAKASYRELVDVDKLIGLERERRRDTDGSPKGTDPQGLDGEAATAGAEGIARKGGA